VSSFSIKLYKQMLSCHIAALALLAVCTSTSPGCKVTLAAMMYSASMTKPRWLWPLPLQVEGKACALPYNSLVSSFKEVLVGVVGVRCGCRKVSVLNEIDMILVAQQL